MDDFNQLLICVPTGYYYTSYVDFIFFPAMNVFSYIFLLIRPD